MATSHSIALFPADIDRDAFGHWLSGFADGEASFFMKLQTYKYAPFCDTRFMIGLRADDAEVLSLIRSFWNCGRITPHVRHSCPGSLPTVDYAVTRAVDLANVVVPHFERYPLFAKKKRDFVLWKRGVEIHYASSLRAARYRPGGKGQIPKTTPEERQEYDALATALREQRKFSASTE